MGDRHLVGRQLGGAFRVDMDKLVIHGGVGKHIDACLINGEPIAYPFFFSQVGFEDFQCRFRFGRHDERSFNRENNSVQESHSPCVARLIHIIDFPMGVT